MAYATEKLQSVAECDILLNEVDIELRLVQVRLLSNDVRNDVSERTHEERIQTIDALEAEIQVLQGQIAVLPEGAKKEKVTTERMEAEVRLRKVRTAVNNSGPIEIVRREGDISVYGATQTALQAFKVALEARRQELSA